MCPSRKPSSIGRRFDPTVPLRRKSRKKGLCNWKIACPTVVANKYKTFPSAVSSFLAAGVGILANCETIEEGRERVCSCILPTIWWWYNRADPMSASKVQWTTYDRCKCIDFPFFLTISAWGWLEWFGESHRHLFEQLQSRWLRLLGLYALCSERSGTGN